ncbi:MAG: hypothetical protein H6657_05380 [Ardenticatenaceae bacterium]|nr:hypothetical protein [Anaerolineales bacterium]MCB8976841.1 hypothetical protein [Ardenticatenaceae bacterium]
MKTKPSNFLRLVILLALLMMSWQTAVAHGGGALQIANAPVADYQVSVWTNPPTARAGQTIHVTVGVAMAGTGEPMLEAEVLATVLDANGQPATSAAATTDQSINRLFYEADLGGLPAGEYELVVRVSGPAGSGPVSVPLSVTPASVLPWVLGVVGAVMFVVFVFLWGRRGKVGVPVRKTAVLRSRSVD